MNNNQKNIVWVMGLLVVLVLGILLGSNMKKPSNANNQQAKTIPVSNNLTQNNIQNPQTGCNANSGPSITVFSPNGGEVYFAGQNINVKWKSCNLSTEEGMAIDIFNMNDQLSGNCPLVGPTLNDGSETVNLSVYSCNLFNFQPGNNFKLRVYQLNSQPGTVVQDFSNNNFTIN